MKKIIIITLSLILLSVVGFYTLNNYIYNQKQNLIEVKLYYQNETLETTEDLCGERGLIPVIRKIPNSENIVQDTVELLLKGELTEKEKKQGAFSEFPLDGFSLIKAEVVNGVAVLEFVDPKYRTSGGSCRVSSLRAQVEKTAKQFSFVSSVKILPEELFQP